MPAADPGASDRRGYRHHRRPVRQRRTQAVGGTRPRAPSQHHPEGGTLMTIPPAITKEPIWADFPTVEDQARVSRCQQLMAAACLDVLMLMQQENVEYFSGFRTGHWASKTFSSA